MQNQFYQTPFQKRSRAAAFRQTSRNALAGSWGLAIGVFLLANILGMNGGISLSFDLSEFSDVSMEASVLLDELRHVDGLLVESGLMEAVRYVLRSWIGFEQLMAFTFGAITAVAVSLFVGAPVTVGYHRFLLDFSDGKSGVGVRTLFSASSTQYWRSVSLTLLLSLIGLGVSALVVAALFLLLSLVGTLWSGWMIILALVVLLVGGVALALITIRLSLCYYITVEYPDLSPVDVIRNSSALMKGNMWRYFCLQISFFGWLLVALCTCGAGMIVVAPYMKMAETAFYAEISGRNTAREVEFPSIDPDDYVI